VRTPQPAQALTSATPPLDDGTPPAADAAAGPGPHLPYPAPLTDGPAAGGEALLRGFAERLEAEAGVPVRLADQPLDCAP